MRDELETELSHYDLPSFSGRHGRQSKAFELLDALLQLEYVCGEATRDRYCRPDPPEQKAQRTMTILPDDRYLSGWQRTKARLQVLIDRFKDFWAYDVVRLPDRWKPKQVEGTGRASDG